MEATARMLRWETLTKTQFDQIDPNSAVVALTCSPIEVHGPHLPLGATMIRVSNRLLGFRNAIA